MATEEHSTYQALALVDHIIASTKVIHSTEGEMMWDKEFVDTGVVSAKYDGGSLRRLSVRGIVALSIFNAIVTEFSQNTFGLLQFCLLVRGSPLSEVAWPRRQAPRPYH